ncbi:hypothetical protein CY34DRAFT_11211 [Suillus luteus UH-Slu-Lm8-n1]|uniref:Uncharacterized protein n=1 Tax=Suillus luteus UH-Slu-Lm8-n1 TaxID=930992 RepID=A0A0D0A2Q1_9AGAM|nr:hypothetical protein CY34DRAFT_11211 [Suillus luteus UH-Slu-Lm8-n1]
MLSSCQEETCCPLPPKVKCRSGHLVTYEESEDEDESRPLPSKTKHPRLVTTPPPPKTKRTRLVESDDDIEDVKAPPIKKKTDVEAPPIKKTMVPPPKTKRTRLVESDEDVDDVKAPPIKKKLVPTPIEAPEELAYKAPPSKKTPVPSRPKSLLPELTEDESNGPLFEPEPLPKKKGKKAAKVQCVPTKQNPTRQKWPNGF